MLCDEEEGDVSLIAGGRGVGANTTSRRLSAGEDVVEEEDICAVVLLFLCDHCCCDLDNKNTLPLLFPILFPPPFVLTNDSKKSILLLVIWLRLELPLLFTNFIWSVYDLDNGKFSKLLTGFN